MRTASVSAGFSAVRGERLLGAGPKNAVQIALERLIGRPQTVIHGDPLYHADILRPTIERILTYSHVIGRPVEPLGDSPTATIGGLRITWILSVRGEELKPA